MTTPFDVLKTRLQVDASYKGPWDCAVRVFRKVGRLLLYGVYTCLYGCLWGPWDCAVRVFRKVGRERGRVDCLCVCMYTAPLSHRSVYTHDPTPNSQPTKPPNPKPPPPHPQEGIKGLFSGAVPRTLYIGPSTALFFVAYGAVRSYIHASPSLAESWEQ